MINILCFGDSNTYGESPERFAPNGLCGRYPRHLRWTGILQERLGSQFYVIEEGLNGRTTVWDDAVEGDKNGKTHLPICLNTHAPLDLVILMLGTNDFKQRFHVTASDIALSIQSLVSLIQSTPNGTCEKPPRILLISPPPVQSTTFLGEIIGDRHSDSQQLSALYEDVSKNMEIDFLDISAYAQSSHLDGLHFDKENHAKVADILYETIQAMFL